MYRDWVAVLPFKANGSSKTRLHLQHSQELAQQWLELALRACRQSRGLDSVWVLTLGDRLELPQGVRSMTQTRSGLNEGLQEWLEHIQPRRWLVLLPDLPRVTGEEIDQLLQACPHPGLALAPDRHGRGCNALAADSCRPQLAFGPDSFLFHRSQGQEMDVAVVQAEGLAHDVDTLEDWETLQWHPV